MGHSKVQWERCMERNTNRREISHSYLNDSLYNRLVYCLYLGTDLSLLSASKLMGNHINHSGMIKVNSTCFITGNLEYFFVMQKDGKNPGGFCKELWHAINS